MYHKGRIPPKHERIVHARLDPKTDRILKKLRKTTGLGDSELVRRGLSALSAQMVAIGPRVVGLGAFESAYPDLGSNKGHLRGFGKK
jgi:hypothetical protein